MPSRGREGREGIKMEVKTCHFLSFICVDPSYLAPTIKGFAGLQEIPGFLQERPTSVRNISPRTRVLLYEWSGRGNGGTTWVEGDRLTSWFPGLGPQNVHGTLAREIHENSTGHIWGSFWMPSWLYSKIQQVLLYIDTFSFDLNLEHEQCIYVRGWGFHNQEISVTCRSSFDSQHMIRQPCVNTRKRMTFSDQRIFCV